MKPRTPSLKLYSKAPRKHPEAQLQKAVVQYLMLTGAPNMLYFSIPNEAKRSPRTAAELKRMGMRPGVADLCVVIEGKAHFMECKSPDGILSREQEKFRTDCWLIGSPYACVNSINEALTILRGWGALRKAAA